MPYSLPSQVAPEAKMHGAFSADTLPTLAKVEEIIEEVDAEINSRIGIRYQLPIVNTTDLLILRAISIALSTERVRAIMDSDAPAETNDNPTSRDAKREGKNARSRLKEIADGALLLSSEPKPVPARVYAGVRACNEPYFKLDKTQW